MYILLSSTEQTYRVDVRTQNVSADAAQVSVGFGAMTKPKLGERGAEQLEYALKSAAAAHAALSPLDWHYKVGAQLNLTPLLGDALVFEAGSNSAGLGYALALHVAFRRKLGKHLPVTMPVVFATGAVESSGVVEKIGHLATKLQGAFNCAQSRHAGEPFVVYYPKANEADVSDELRAQALTLGGRLVAVSRVGEALVDLLGDTYDGDLASRLEPFKGLASFDYADHFLFFGREEALSRLLTDYSNASGLLMVTGVSGAGKSSLIKAGLLPQLLKANPSLRYRITQPKQHESLSALLQYLLDNDYPQCAVNAKDLLTQDKEAETTFITYAKEQPATFWYLDQFEEAANLFGEELESSQFTASLHRLASAIPNLSIVASVRSEYVSNIGFVPNESPVSQSIPPLGFEAIIENQAKAFGLHYEEGLVARLVEDATTIQHALPALEYMLQQMNEQRKQTPDSKALTHAQYDALGGLKGGITQQLETSLQAHDRQSDEFFEHAIGLNETGQLYARSLIKEQISTHLQPLIHALIDKQLLIGWQTEQGTRLRLAHDSLLQTSWPRLKAWLEPENSTSRKGYLQWLEHNWGDFQKWSALNGNEQAKEYLLTRNNLTEGNAHLTAANLIQRQDVRDYISASQVHQQDKERIAAKAKQKRLIASIFVAIAFIVALLLVYRQYHLTEQAEAHAVGLENKIVSIEESIELEIKKDLIISVSNVGLYVEDEIAIAHPDKVRKILFDNSINKLKKQELLNLLTEAPDINDPEIVNVLKSMGLSFDYKSLIEMPELHRLIIETKSMDDKERQYWLNVIPKVSSEKIGRLYEILKTEKNKLTALDEQVASEFKALNHNLLIGLNDIISEQQGLSLPSEKTKSIISVVRTDGSEDVEYSIGMLNSLLEEESKKRTYASIEAYSILAELYEKKKDYLNAIESIENELDLRRELNFGVTDDLMLKKNYKLALLFGAVADFSSGERYLMKAVGFLDSIGEDKKNKNHEIDIDKARRNIFFDLMHFQLSQSNIEGAKYSASKIKEISCSECWRFSSAAENYKTKVIRINGLLEIFRDFQSAGKIDAQIASEIESDLYGDLSYYYLYERQPNNAIDFAKKGLKLRPNELWIKTNLAHGYLLSGQIDLAMNIYTYNKSFDVGQGKKFKDAVIEDFHSFREFGLVSEYFEKVELMYSN